MRLAGLAGCASLLVTACSDGATANNSGAGTNNSARPKNATEAQQRVRAMSESDRNGELVGAIRKADQACRQIERSELISETNNVLTYMVGCDRGYEYVVVIRDDGSAFVQPAMREEER